MRLALLCLSLAVIVDSLKMLPPPGLKPARERFATTPSTPTKPMSSPLDDDFGNSASTLTILKRPKGLRQLELSSASREIGEMGRAVTATTPYTIPDTHRFDKPSTATKKSWRNGLGVHTQVVTTLVDQHGQQSMPTHIAIPAYRVKYAPKGSASEIQLTDSDWSTLRYGSRRIDDNVIN
ncbi:hypothetical protein PMAYCL1PPCAC_19463 [Pristionchus mayeri]|uniref:Uncharacterized protein n=1 Tax=Pristionchus mayeri TaxID=1317129 RepID=A0AAN5CRJ1_9BILA|nr:hypothetical protein PMAYCL1PPCAC_19463 [Pristionchus mayeri]